MAKDYRLSGDAGNLTLSAYERKTTDNYRPQAALEAEAKVATTPLPIQVAAKHLPGRKLDVANFEPTYGIVIEFNQSFSEYIVAPDIDKAKEWIDKNAKYYSVGTQFFIVLDQARYVVSMDETTSREY